MLHRDESLAAAAAAALAAVGGAGGLGGAICVSADGAIAMPLTSELMSRAWRCGDGETFTALGADDEGAAAAAAAAVTLGRARRR